MNRKKIFAAFLMTMVTLLMIGASALAESIAPVPMAQIAYVAPAGIKDIKGAITVETRDGSLSITMDDDKVDWARAFASTGLNGTQAQIIWQIKPPTTDVGVDCYAMTVSAQDDSAALEIFSQSSPTPIAEIDTYGVPCDGSGMPITERGMQIATAILDMNYVVPENVNQTFYVRWWDANQQVLSTQKLTITITHTKSAAFEAQEPISNRVAANRIDPDTTPGVTVLEKKEGCISYCVPKSDRQVTTRILAPTKATQYATVGNMKTGTLTAQTLADGKYAEINTFSSGNARSSTSTVYFLDEHGTILETVSVDISIQPEAEMKVWPAYYDEAYTFKESQLQIINDATSMGYTYTYDQATGHLLCRFNGQQRNGAAPKNQMSLRVTVPNWATACRVYTVGSNHELGAFAGSIEKLKLELDKIYRNGATKVSAGTVMECDRFTPFRVIQPEADQITLYVPDASAWVENYAYLCVVEWIDAQGTADYQYLYMTTQPFTAAKTRYPVYAQGDLPAPVQHPCVVGPQNLYLAVTRYITQGDSAWHYELSLEDANGNPVTLNAPVKVYLPFPEGHVQGSVYTMHHYTDGLYDDTATNRYQPIEIQETAYGLMFETGSFSPFILSRQGGDSASADAQTQPPKTGDESPLTLWLCLTVLSAAAAVLLWRKRKAA